MSKLVRDQVRDVALAGRARHERWVHRVDGDQFAKQEVVVSARDDRYAQISWGLVPNDVVVTDGKMQVYTKSLYQ